MNNILSPLNGGITELITEIPTQVIINGYKNTVLSTDVNRFFEGIDKIKLLECKSTGFRFYYPYNIDGDGKFYEQLQTTPNYYPLEKWEFDKSIKLIKKGAKVLEIGCGKGIFLNKIKEKCDAVGLELNESVLKEAKENNIKILIESIQEHAKSHQNYYDIVCSFQVVEHIQDIHSFIKASLDSLKPGGIMIIAVPNNECLFYDFSFKLKWHKELQDLTFLLNSPPHHMGQWNTKSLKSLKSVFGLKDVRIYYEPIPYFRKNMLIEIIYHKFMFPFNKILSKILQIFFSKIRKHVKGDTILGVYTK